MTQDPPLPGSFTAKLYEKTFTIMLVEDSNTYATQLTAWIGMLAKTGQPYKIIRARTCEEGLSILEGMKKEELPEVMVTDGDTASSLSGVRLAMQLREGVVSKVKYRDMAIYGWSTTDTKYFQELKDKHQIQGVFIKEDLKPLATKITNHLAASLDKPLG